MRTVRRPGVARAAVHAKALPPAPRANLHLRPASSVPRSVATAGASLASFRPEEGKQMKPRKSFLGLLRPKSSAAVTKGEENKGTEMLKTAILGSMFLAWYGFNIYFNIYNKQVLKKFRYPVSSTTLQFGVGSLLAIMAWILQIQALPDFDNKQALQSFLTKLLPIASVHALGNLLTNVSLGKVAVSFTHTIKSLEPFFSVLFSGLFLGDWAHPAVMATLLPIVAGVSLASFTEASFNWMGLGAAMGSNVFFQSRNVISKLVMGDNKKKVDALNLFSMITIMSFLLMLPIQALTEPTVIGDVASGLIPKDTVVKALKAAVCFHAYQQVSYAILSKVSPVTHSVGNCVKRVVVIASSILFFRNPVSPLNLAGAAVALSGVGLYSTVKRMSMNWDKEKKD